MLSEAKHLWSTLSLILRVTCNPLAEILSRGEAEAKNDNRRGATIALLLPHPFIPVIRSRLFLPHPFISTSVYSPD